jgi:hypothetical protein
MWSLGISNYKYYNDNMSTSNCDIKHLIQISGAYSEKMINSGNDNINNTGCSVGNKINISYTCSMFWNETSAFDDNIENSSADSLKDNFNLNLGLAVPMGIAMYLLSLVTVVGNAMVLHAVRTEHRLRTVSTNILIHITADS